MTRALTLLLPRAPPDGYRVHKLHEVNVTVMPRLDCNKHYKGRVRPSMFCAGKVTGGADACQVPSGWREEGLVSVSRRRKTDLRPYVQGDSGGPLSCLMDSRYQLAGLVSWGVGCGRVDRPGVYVRLGQYLEWIAKVIGGWVSGWVGASGRFSSRRRWSADHVSVCLSACACLCMCV